jgi:hypothetical protein
VGGQKPWKKQFLKSVCRRGESPSRADRLFFRHVEAPIRLYNPIALSLKRASILTASLVGRFVRRGGFN